MYAPNSIARIAAVPTALAGPVCGKFEPVAVVLVEFGVLEVEGAGAGVVVFLFDDDCAC